jgi:predicted DNA-binding transcriptional regulator YafY
LANGVHDTLAYRLSEILTKLNMGESLDPQDLADQFGVNRRTIQRDLNVRFGCLPLIKSGGRYRMDEAHLGKLTIKDIKQFALLSGVNGLFPQMTEQFLRRIFDASRDKAWMVKGHSYEDLHEKTSMFADLERAIVGRQLISFEYTNSQGQHKTHSQVEPYKLINNKGIWYLAAWEGDKLKSFSVTKLEALRTEQTTFEPRPNVEKELSSNESIWLGAVRQRVVLRVASAVAGYFKRRKLIANQLIERELENGDILVSTTVAQADEVLPIIRYWIPHIQILEPLDMQQQLEAGLRNYLNQDVSSK